MASGSDTRGFERAQREAAVSRCDEALRESEERLELVLEGSQLGFWDWDIETGEVRRNARWAEMLGYTLEDIEFSVRQWSDWIHPEDRERALASIKEHLEGRSPEHHAEYRMVHKDGGFRWILDRARVVRRDAEGRPLRMSGTHTDITDSRETQEALRRSEAEYRALIRESPLGIAMFNEQGFLYANPAFLALAAYSMTDLLTLGPKGIDAVLDPAEAAAIHNLLAGAQENQTRSHEFQVLTGHGKYVWVEGMSKRVIRRGALAVQTTVVDVSPLKDREEALRREKIFTDTALDAQSDVFFVFDLESRKPLRWNRVTREYTGYSDSEIRRLRVPDDWFRGRELERARKAIRNLLTHGTATEELSISAGDGRLLPFEFRATVAPGIDGSPDCVITVGRDISERRRTEEALRDSMETAAEIMDSIPSGLYTYQFISPDQLVLLSGNAAAHALTGLDAAQSTGMHFDEIWPSARESGLTEALFRVVRTGESMVREEYAYRDERLAGVYRITAFRIPGERLGIAFEDITERQIAAEQRRDLELQMQHAQKLESLGVLAGGIAHDFNNILVAVLGNADLALQDLDSDSPVRPLIEEIEKAARRAAGLTRQMLAYSGRGQFVIKDVDLNELVEEMSGLLRSSISKRVRLELDLAPALPSVRADEPQLQQIVMNLITNAGEAFPEDQDGLVTLRTRTKSCGQGLLERSRLPEKPPPGNFVCLEVADTGCGMEKATIDKMFDPFYTTKFFGRGLGMSAVLGIVRGHRGAIIVDSRPGEGTLFQILLPLDGSASVRAEQPIPLGRSAGWKGRGRILLVDDEVQVLHVGKRMLTRMGFEVLTAQDGREACAMFEEAPDSVRLIILDLSMPKMDGEQTLEALRVLRPEVPVVISSGYTTQDLAERFANHKVDGFIQKPFIQKVLMERIREALGE